MKKQKRKLRRDGSMIKPAGWEEVFFVSHTPNEPARRSTIFVSALLQTKADRRWFEQVVERPPKVATTYAGPAFESGG